MHWQHRSRPEPSRIPVFSFDYLIFDRINVKESANDPGEDEETFEVLVAKDRHSKSVFAHAVANEETTMLFNAWQAA